MTLASRFGADAATIEWAWEFVVAWAGGNGSSAVELRRGRVMEGGHLGTGIVAAV